jgi:hypothetical protein
MLKWRYFVFGVLFAAVCVTSMAQTNLRRWSTQEAANKLAKAKPRQYSTQEALNLLANEPAMRDTLVTLFTWVMDDGDSNLWSWRDSFETYNQEITVSVLTYNSLYGVAGYLTPAQLRTLESDYGWDMQGHGWAPSLDQGGPSFSAGLWRASGVSDSIRAMHRGEVSYADYLRDAQRCYAAFDTLGLKAPRGWSGPNYSTTHAYKRALAIAGFEYGFQPDGNATGETGGGTQDRYNWLSEIYFANSAKIRGLAAYPNVLPPRYEIPQTTGDASTVTTFRTAVWDAIAMKGSWITHVGHSPADFSGSFGTVLKFVDSLQTLGLIRVVTAREGFDLMWNTPIGESANFLYPNFTDHNSDDIIDGMDGTRDLIDIGNGTSDYSIPGTRDSVYHSLNCANCNHGVMGQGYASMANGPGYTNPDFKGANEADAQAEWWKSSDVMWILPNAFRGKTVIFECWVQIDPDIEDVDGTALSDADSMGVTFYALMESEWNTRGVTSSKWYTTTNRPAFGTAAEQDMATLSFDPRNNQTYMGNFQTIEPGDTVGGDWQHIYGSWAVPSHAHYLAVCIVKDSRFDALSVRISNPSISIAERRQDHW